MIFTEIGDGPLPRVARFMERTGMREVEARAYFARREELKTRLGLALAKRKGEK